MNLLDTSAEYERHLMSIASNDNVNNGVRKVAVESWKMLPSPKWVRKTSNNRRRNYISSSH